MLIRGREIGDLCSNKYQSSLEMSLKDILLSVTTNNHLIAAHKCRQTFNNWLKTSSKPQKGHPLQHSYHSLSHLPILIKHSQISNSLKHNRHQHTFNNPYSKRILQTHLIPLATTFRNTFRWTSSGTNAGPQTQSPQSTGS